MGIFKEKLAQIMYGRYGSDQLNNGLLVVYFIIAVANTFVHSPIISMVMWAVLILVFFRMLSRNAAKRRRENDKFMKFWKPLKGKFALPVLKVKEFKTRRFRKCPNCKTVVRLPIPKKKGKHTVGCPNCHKDFKVYIAI